MNIVKIVTQPNPIPFFSNRLTDLIFIVQFKFVYFWCIFKVNLNSVKSKYFATTELRSTWQFTREFFFLFLM